MSDVLSVIFVLSIIFTLAFPIYFGMKKQVKEMWAIIVAGFLAMTFCNLDRFVRFKAPGFEAEIQQRINEAYATMENLRELAVDVVEPVLTLLIMQDRMLQYLSRETKIEIKEEIVQSLSRLDVPQSKIKEATRFFDAVLIKDHLERLRNIASKSNEVQKTAKDRLRELADLSSPEELNRVDVTEIAQLLGNAINLDPEVKEAFLDLKYFLQKRRFRRPET